LAEANGDNGSRGAPMKLWFPCRCIRTGRVIGCVISLEEMKKKTKDVYTREV